MKKPKKNKTNKTRNNKNKSSKNKSSKAKIYKSLKKNFLAYNKTCVSLEDKEQQQLVSLKDPEQERLEKLGKLGLAIVLKHIKESKIPQERRKTDPNTITELVTRNFFTELGGMYDIGIYERPGTFDYYRMKIFQAMSILLLDSDLTPAETEHLNQELHQIGVELFELEGMTGMHDPLIWLFLPKSWQSTLNFAWDGIGDWRA